MAHESPGTRRRRLLLQAALDHFSSMGYEKSTTRSIAESTGCTEAVLFQYFPSKRDLFETCLEKFAPDNPLHGLHEESDIEHMTLVEATGAYLRHYLDCMWQHRKWFGMLVQESARDEKVMETVQNHRGPTRHEFEEFLRKRADNGEIPPDRIMAVSRIVTDATCGFLHRVFRESPDDFEASRDRFVEPLLEGIRLVVSEQ